MSISDKYKNLVIRYSACWGILLASLVLFPLLSWLQFRYRLLPGAAGELLFFWPQYLFLPNGLTQEQGPGPGIVAATGAVYAAALFWAVVVALYVWVLRRRSAALLYAGFVPVVAAVLQAVMLALGSFGFGVVLDGP